MRHATQQQGFVEVADRVWVSRLPWYDVNVTAVAGRRGVVLLDTHGSVPAGRAVLEDVAALGPLVAAVDTHAHHDHVLGNAAVREAHPDVPVIAHEAAAVELEAWERDPKDVPVDEPRREEILASRVVVPDTTFSSVHVIDLGDRAVELVHPGPAHTGGDLVARVADAGTDVLVVGDLVEESGPPAYGADSHPLDWPAALDLVITLTGKDTLVVPGHGAPVDRAYVERQRADIATVAETLRDLASRGVPAEQALASAEWPFPATGLEHAVRRAYDALPPPPPGAGRQLPLV